VCRLFPGDGGADTAAIPIRPRDNAVDPFRVSHQWPDIPENESAGRSRLGDSFDRELRRDLPRYEGELRQYLPTETEQRYLPAIDLSRRGFCNTKGTERSGKFCWRFSRLLCIRA
jgi:hypothetical protein